ncbi:collagen-binding protein [Segetibacter aerophilus]|uniref:Collagen-binding protein n=2 Tax=Segetibacter aerophilus TaxID=670293 RepID=A0A512BEL7_9BACT|nr:collagen-binding protein [Segetibacter aerophilus]
MTTFVSVNSQTIVRGVIRDAVSQQPLQSVSIYFKGGKGVTSSSDGSYMLATENTRLTVVQFSYVGYKTVSKTLIPNKEQVIDILLEVSDAKSNVVVKTNKRGKYSNKNNPAVELIRQVIDNKDKNRISAYDYVSYEQYEKMEVLLTKTPEKLLNNKFLKNFKFVFQNNDTTKIQGRAMLPVYINEISSQKYYRKNPEKKTTYIIAEKEVNFGEYLDVKGINSYLERMYEDVDVYQNNISLLSNQFLSPIADMAPTFYRFYIADTTEVDGVELVRLNFAPRNLNDLLFKGTLFVTLDGNYSVQKLVMSISKHANLNFVRELHVNQDFEKGQDGRFHLALSNTIVEFALAESAKTGIVGERTVSFKSFTINQPQADSIYKGDAVVRIGSQNAASDTFWQAHRSPPLSEAEVKVYSNIDSLTHLKSFKTFMDVATLLMAGYKSFGGYEVGPVNSFYSFNPVEGLRTRIGGRTTPRFNRNIYLENYVAYGFKDQKWKYYGAVAYSFNHSSIYAYPLNYLKLGYQRDTKIPGQELQFVVEDNFLLSFKRGNNDRWLYNSIFKTEYVREFGKDFGYTLGFKNWKQTPAGIISYLKPDGSSLVNVPNLTTTELSAEFTWAPHRQFYQGKRFRIPIINKYPIFKFRFITGIKGLVKGEYNYQNLNLTIDKRLMLSQLGFADVKLEGGNIFGKVPYPLMTVHRANQTYSYQLESYNLMNFLEFVSDHYAAFSIDQHFNGFFLNKIPLLKKLKWREVASAKVLYGGVRDENNPDLNLSTIKFPVDKQTGLPTTYSLNKSPYIEVSVGVSNILKLLRIDFVKRLTYLDHPEVTEWGIRTRVKFDF